MSVDITISARDKVSQTMDAITRSVEELNKALEEVQEQSDETGRGVNSAFERVQSTVGKVGHGFQTVGRGLTKHITKPAIAAGGALAGLTLKKGFSRMQQIDEARAKIKAMGQDFDSIKQAALDATKGTAFALNDALTAGASAAAAGVKKANMPKYMQAVADTAAVAGTSFDEMGMVFNKVMANGKMSAEEWNMLTDRGVDVFGALRKETGKTNEELLEMRKNGEITSDTFLNAFANAYEKIDGKTLAQRIGESTISGAFANINASLARIGANFLGDTEDASTFAGRLLDLMKSVQGALGKVEDKASELGKAFGNLTGPTMEKMTNFFNGIADGSVKIDVAKAKMAGIAAAAATLLGPALTIAGKAMILFAEHGGKLKGIGAAFKKIGPNVLKIGGPIALIATGLIEAWKNSDKFRTSVGNLFSTLWESIKSVATALAPILQSVIAIIGPVAGALGDLMAPLVDLMAQYAAGVAEKISTIATAIQPIAEKVADAVQTASAKIEEMGGAWEALKTGTKTLVLNIKSKALEILDKIKEKWDGFKTGAKTLKVNVAKGVQDRIDAIKEAWDGFKTKGKELKIKISGGAQKALEKIQSIWNGIKTTTKNLTLNLLGGAKEILDAIMDAWDNLDTTAKKLVLMFTGAGIVHTLANIKDVWNAVKEKTKTLGVRVSGGAAAALRAIKKAWNAIKAKAKSLTVKVLGGAKGMLDAIKKAWDLIKSATKNYTVKVLGGAAGALGTIKSAWSAISSGTKTLKVITQKITEKITRHKDEGATGIRSSMGGMTLVGERGPEILNLPKGASVHTARESEAVLKGLAATQLPVPIQMPQIQTMQPQNLSPQNTVAPPAIQQAAAGTTNNTSLNIPIDINMARSSSKGLSIDEIISEVSKKLEEVLSSSAEGVMS